MHNLIWRLMLRPWVDRMQRLFLPKSTFNTTVCDGIADLLAHDYAPLTRPAVVRSIPPRAQMPFRETGERINVLYHGIVYPVRGMELALESLRLWRPEFHLTVRGPGKADYCENLRHYARELGVADRFTLEPPVLYDRIISEANKADIGYFVHKDTSPQKRFALPNKFFEYISAGLALCVSDLPEMAKIMKAYDLGVLVNGYSAEEVAAQINALSREEIDRYKRNALEAAQRLCWEQEALVMVERYNGTLGGFAVQREDGAGKDENRLSYIGSAA
jgi:glycosyltransferase involved in cell wall biosynthesis